MVVTEEIDPLRTIAIDAVELVLAPKFLAELAKVKQMAPAQGEEEASEKNSPSRRNPQWLWVHGQNSPWIKIRFESEYDLLS